MDTDNKTYTTETKFHAWARTGLIAVIAVAVVIVAVKAGAALGRLSALVDTLDTEVAALKEEAGTIESQASELLGSARGMMADMDTVVSELSDADIGGIMSNLDEVVKTIHDADLASVIDDLHTAVNNLNTAVEPLAKLFGGGR